MPTSDNTPGKVEDVSVSTAYGDDLYYPRNYVNSPNIRIGDDRLQIYEDQGVLCPIIIAYEVAVKPYMDWGVMQDYTGLTIDYGDNPPTINQLTIDGDPLNLSKIQNSAKPVRMEDFRIGTPIFTVVVPEADYGRSIKDFLEMSIPSGRHAAQVEGYFVLLRFPARKDPYLVHSWASAPRETRSPYFSELIYEIEVPKRPVVVRNIPTVAGGEPLPPIINSRPSRNEGVIAQTLIKKMSAGELGHKQLTNLQDYIKCFPVDKARSIKGMLPSTGNSPPTGSSLRRRRHSRG